MQEWYSERFRCWVYLTQHAIKRMEERDLNKNMIGELIETGIIHKKDDKRIWVYKSFLERNDNLICAAITQENKLIIKTVMHRWELMEESI